MHARARASRVALVGAFLLAIAWPAVDTRLRPGAVRSALVEFRVPAPRPTWPRDLAGWERLPRHTESWIADNFGARDLLLELHNRLDWFVWDRSPSNVLKKGRGGWIFYDDSGELEAARGARPFTPRELAGWMAYFSAKGRWVAERGGHYVCLLVPSKELIYPERLPDGGARVGPSRLEQVLAAARDLAQAQLLDLAPALRAAKVEDGPGDWLFHPLGTHWTDRGAYVGYCAIAEALAARFEIGARLERSRMVRFADRPDSLAGRMYMEEVLRASAIGLGAPPEHTSALEPAEFPVGPGWIARREDPRRPSGILLHDSTGPQLARWLAPHFRLWKSAWSEIDLDWIDAERPEVLIDVYTDRMLVNHAPALYPFESRPRVEASFAAARPVARFDLSKPVRGLTVDGGLGATRSSAGLLLACQDPAAMLRLAPFEFARDESVLLALDVTVRDPSELKLFFEGRFERGVSRNRSLAAPLPAGRSTVLLEGFATGLGPGIALNFLDAPFVLLHGLELRASAALPAWERR